MGLSVKNKISRRIHPVPYLLYNWEAKLKGHRSRRRAQKHGEPVEVLTDHVHCYITLSCNFKCYFCVNRLYTEVMPNFTCARAEKWLYLINRLYGLHEIYLQGGEPSLHPDFVEIVNGLDGYNVCVFTNLPKETIHKFKQLRKNNNNIILKISYHPYTTHEGVQPEESVNLFVRRLRQIPKGIKWQVHLIDITEVSFSLYARAFRRYNVVIHREDFSYEPQLRNFDMSAGSHVYCRSNMEVISPDMRIYPCLGLMMKKVQESSVPAMSVKSIKPVFRPCNYYGLCGQCSTAKEIHYISEKGNQ